MKIPAIVVLAFVGFTGAVAAAPQPEVTRAITLPRGTALRLTLDSTVASNTSRTEQAVRAHLARAVIVGGTTVLPAGSPLSGIVTSVVRPGRVKGRGHVAIRFESLTRGRQGEHYRIEASPVSRTAPATKGDDAATVAAPAVAGAIIGAIAGGGKGAAVGTAVGAGGGGAIVMSTRGRDVRLPRGTVVTVRLTEALVVRVPHGR